MEKLLVSLVSVSFALSSAMVAADSVSKSDSNIWTFKGRTSFTDNSSLYTEGPTVTTSPYLGIRSAFNASDLIVNLSTMNEDLRFLEQQQKLKQRLDKQNGHYLDRPLVELSGDVVGQAYWGDSYHGSSRHDVNLTSARFDIFAHAGPWAMGYVSTDFDNGPLDGSLRGTGFRLSNSRIFLKRAFLTIGNLDEAPVYFSLGQMYVPFGRYATSTVTTPVTVALAQTNTRAALLGMSYEGFYGSAFGFRGDSDVHSTGINQWGLNAGYRYSCDPMSIEVGGGYIANLADSAGMQLTGHQNIDEFGGFGVSAVTEELVHRVPAFDAHMEFHFEDWGVNAEYIAATRHFAFEDLNYNGHGAKPVAVHAEVNYRFNISDLPASVAVAYGHTDHALALRLPKDSFFGTFNVSLWKNTIQSLEYRYDNNYHSGTSSGGATVLSQDAIINALPLEEGSVINGVGPLGGGHRNTILAQIGVYF